MLQGISGSPPVAIGQASTDRHKLEDDLNRFLNLLVTQLRNQDPLDPLDANEFTSQLVQFASVEQQIYQNANLEKLVAGQQNAQIAAVVGYLGTTVEATGNSVPLENGRATLNYTLDQAAQETIIAVKDATGRVLFVKSGETAAGRHTFSWDGRDPEGRPMPDGAYTVAISASRADGSAVAVSSTLVGRVTAASVDNGSVVLSLGAVDVPIATVRRIEETKPVAGEANRP
ncbi:MAG: flagellar hook assembly protein FlgD [Rhodospirillales bacterium]